MTTPIDRVFQIDSPTEAGDAYTGTCRIAKTRRMSTTPATTFAQAFDTSTAVEIDWFADGDTVSVLPRDRQRFEIQKDVAIRVLEIAEHAEKQLTLLLQRLAEWIRIHQAAISAAYVTLRDQRLAFIVVSRDVECDDELEDAVSALDLELANDPNLDGIGLNAMVLPPASPEALASFFDPRFLMTYRGLGS
jgi:hypothetical protein